MPELPEVETVVRTLRPRLVGRRIEGLWSSGQRLRLGRPFAAPAVARVCVGARVRAIDRQAKYILLALAGGTAGPGTVVVHLGMSGRLRVHAASEPRVLHTHVVWTLDDGHELRFSDPRRFGNVCAALDGHSFPELASLGPDPLTALTAEELRRRMTASRAPLKSFLLDQKRVAGLGNIYVCEALFHARIHPGTPAARAVRRAPALFDGIRLALNTALEHGGTTLRDFVDSDGHFGTHQDALMVYAREGRPCFRCGRAILRRVDAGRSTFYCGRCQR